MSKRILFSGLAYYPNVGFGGPIRVMRSYGMALTSRGHQVTIYCTNIADRQMNKMSDHTTEVIRDGMRIVYLNTNLNLSDGFVLSVDLVRYLWRELGSYDLVHMFGPRDLFTGMTALLARKRGIPYFMNAVGTIPYNKSKVIQKTLWDAIIGRQLIHGSRYVIEATNEQMKDLLDYGLPQSKIAIVPWGPDPDIANAQVTRGIFRSKFNIPPEGKVILFLGRIHRIKRVDLLIRALVQLGDPTAYLVVVGHDDDGCLDELKKLARDCNLENQIVWTGPIHSPENASVYHDADVFALISDHESAPVALLEACSMGLPVLISDFTGMSKLVHNQAGLVVDMTPAAVADGLRCLFLDADLRSKLGHGARLMIEQHFSSNSIGAMLERIYDIED
jgi:glycosyltransferase involved in cell wall biosynthesis